VRAPQWALVQYRLPGDARIRAGALVGDTVTAPPPGLETGTLMDALARWDEVTGLLAGWTPDPDTAVPGAVLAAPLTYPAKILGSGANYYSHAAEMGSGPPDPDGMPFFFLKPPTTTVIGPHDPIPYPAYDSVQLDWEAELGVVIGRTAKNVSRGQALDHVAGYLVANDLSARDKAARADAVSAHFVYDWLGHKGQDGFCPMGPGIVPKWQIPDPQRLRLRLSVNGVTKQDSSTADMVISVAGLIAGASRMVTLQPGDVILTGTPAGVGMPRHEFLLPDDTVIVEIDGIGALRNRVSAA
jgi:2-keto-4-pentenoate hydratase/2-oxohepta-3-ene-1,7-dioic acid hydratase in catechol pathway